MSIPFISSIDVEKSLSWECAIRALIDGHHKRLFSLSDSLIKQNNSALLTRSASIDGLGYGVKAVSVFPENKTGILPTIQGLM